MPPVTKTRTWVQDVPSSVRTFMVKVTKPTGKEPRRQYRGVGLPHWQGVSNWTPDIPKAQSKVLMSDIYTAIKVTAK